MDIEQAMSKAINSHMTSISIDDCAFVPLIKINRTQVKNATQIRVILAARRSHRIHFFLQRYEDKITLIHSY
jgi:hypothetical protein